MKRDFQRLADGPFDLLVIGGGIYGAWTACDAALRGLKVALVDRTDWSAGTSSASSKLLHGGLRYLEHGDFGLVRKSLHERRLLWRAGPHRVRPLRFVLPVYRGARVGRLRLKAGLLLYDLLAGGQQPVAPHRYLGSAALLRAYPLLRGAALRGGFTYGDCQTDDARMTVEIVAGASAAGAVCVNRAEVVDLLVDRGRVLGAAITDHEAGGTVELRATVTADCSGAWSDRLLAPHLPAPRPPNRLSKGVHLLLPALPVDDAFLLPSDDDRRVIFMLPWYGRTLLGTTDTDFAGSPDTLRVTAAETRYLLDLANAALCRPWSPSDIVGGFAGLRTLLPGDDDNPSAATREFAIEEPLAQLVRAVGGKYTSARVDAARLVDRLARSLGSALPGCATQGALPWKPAQPDEWRRDSAARALRLGLEEAAIAGLQERYGSTLERLLSRIEHDRALARPIVGDAPFCWAEVAHAVEFEMARGLDDVLRRRLPLALVSRLERPTLERVAGMVGDGLGWSAARRETELAEFVRRGGQVDEPL